MKKPVRLFEFLRQRIPPGEWACLEQKAPQLEDEEWEEYYHRLVERSVRLGRRVRWTRQRIERLYQDFEKVPRGRRATVLASSPWTMLLALVCDLIRRSYAARFSDARRSLELADLALESMEALDESPGLAAELKADLRAEVYVYLGNARRLNADFVGAERAFETAESHRREGTGDIVLQADLLNFRATLEFALGRGQEAATSLEREVRLRRLLREPDRLGKALLDLCRVISWTGSLDRAIDLLEEAVEHTEAPVPVLSALLALGERFARDGEGARAWRVTCSAQTLVFQSGVAHDHPGFLPYVDWVEGLAHRALGDLERSSNTLEKTRASFATAGASQREPLARVTLDLAAIYAARGRSERARRLAEQAYAHFQAIGLEGEALAALQMLCEAARAESLGSRLALGVADFVARRQYDPGLQFEAAAR